MHGLAEHRQRRRKEEPASTGTRAVETQMLALVQALLTISISRPGTRLAVLRLDLCLDSS